MDTFEALKNGVWQKNGFGNSDNFSYDGGDGRGDARGHAGSGYGDDGDGRGGGYGDGEYYGHGNGDGGFYYDAADLAEGPLLCVDAAHLAARAINLIVRMQPP